jgi:hypothetical protein
MAPRHDAFLTRFNDVPNPRGMTTGAPPHKTAATLASGWSRVLGAAQTSRQVVSWLE